MPKAQVAANTSKYLRINPFKFVKIECGSLLYLLNLAQSQARNQVMDRFVFGHKRSIECFSFYRLNILTKLANRKRWNFQIIFDRFTSTQKGLHLS